MAAGSVSRRGFLAVASAVAAAGLAGCGVRGPAGETRCYALESMEVAGREIGPEEVASAMGSGTWALVLGAGGGYALALGDGGLEGRYSESAGRSELETASGPIGVAIDGDEAALDLAGMGGEASSATFRRTDEDISDVAYAVVRGDALDWSVDEPVGAQDAGVTVTVTGGSASGGAGELSCTVDNGSGEYVVVSPDSSMSSSGGREVRAEGYIEAWPGETAEGTVELSGLGASRGAHISFSILDGGYTQLGRVEVDVG